MTGDGIVVGLFMLSAAFFVRAKIEDSTPYLKRIAEALEKSAGKKP